MSQFRVNPHVVGGILEEAGAEKGAADRLAGLSWLMILEEAGGVTRAEVAQQAGVSLLDLEELRYFVVRDKGFAAGWGDEETQAAITACDSIWLQGIAAVRTSALMTQQAIGQGWDQVEAIAVDKVATYLSEMTAHGDPIEMLEIATKANKAIRRSRGEGNSRGNGGFGMAGTKNGDGGIDASLSIPTDSGVMTLNLSSRVRTQIENAQGQVIDGQVTNRLGGIRALEMLSVSQTRALVSTDKETESTKDEGPESSAFKKFLDDMGSKI